MSLLTIPSDIYKWLQSLNLVKDGKKMQQSKIQLPKPISQGFMVGSYIGNLIKILCKNEQNFRQITLNLQTLRENPTPAIKLYNWNILIQSLKKIGIFIDSEMKKSILEGQSKTIVLILQKIYDKFTGKSSDKTMKILQVDLASINKKSLNQSINILEFVLISLSKNLKLSAQQALNLFLDNNKYLAHLLVKGVKNVYEPILEFLSDVKSNIELIIINLFVNEEKISTEFLMNILKAGLISKDQEVATNTYKIFKIFHEIYNKKNLDFSIVTNWIRNEGINSFLFSLKKHQILTEQIIQLLLDYLKEDFFVFVHPNSKNSLWSSNSQILNFFYFFIQCLHSPLLQAFQQTKQMKEWIVFLIKLIEDNEIDMLTKIQCISLMEKIWFKFPQYFENHQKNLPNIFINTVKQLALQKGQVISNRSLIILFNLKLKLGKQKNALAPLIYKTIVNIFDASNDTDKIVFIIKNLIISFKQLQNLPAPPILNPLLRFMQTKLTSDMLQLCNILIDQNKLNNREKLKIIDIICKTIMKDNTYSDTAFDMLELNLEKLEYDDQFQELIINSCKLGLSIFYAHQKNTRSLVIIKKEHEKYKQKLGKAVVQQINLFMNMRNITKLIEFFIIKYPFINQKMDLYISHTYLQIKKQIHKQSKLMFKLLKAIHKNQNDVIESLKKYDDQNKEEIHLDDKNIQKNNQPNKPRMKSMIDQTTDKSQLDINSISPNIRVKNKATKLGDLSSYLDIKNLKPSKQALKNIEQIRSKRQQLRLKSVQIEYRNKQILKKNQKIAKNLLQIRHIKYGIGNQPDQQIRCIYDFDNFKQYQTQSISYLNLQDQEDFTGQSISSYIKKFKKVWRFLFFKYSSSGARSKQSSSPFKTEEKINIVQIWKMIRDYQIAIIKKEQLQTLLRLVNEKFGQKSDIYNLTYIGFEEFIVQFCVFIYSRQDKGFKHAPLVRHIQQFVSQLKQITLSRQGNIQIFVNPENFYLQQGQIIKEFNRRLAEDPKYILPQGYKKVKQVQINFHYKLNDKFVMKQNFKIVIQIFSEIFSDIFKVNLIEPQTQKVQTNIAKPILFQNLAQKLKNYKKGYLLPRNLSMSEDRSDIKIKHIDKNQFHPMVKFSLGIKLGISNVSIKYKYIAQEVAYWIDDMLDAVEKGQLKVKNKAKKQIQNEYLRRKKEQILKKKTEMIQEDKRFSSRHDNLKIILEKQKQQQKKKKQQQQTKRKFEKLEEIKKRNEKEQQYKKIREFLSKKKQQQQQKKEKRLRQQQQNQKLQKQNYKKKVEEYFQAKKNEVKAYQQQLKKKKLQQQQNLQKKQKQFQEKCNQIYHNNIKQNQQLTSKVSETKNRYLQSWNSKPIQKINQKYSSKVKMLFDLLLIYQKSKNLLIDISEISMTTFNLFALKFKILPYLINKNYLTIIFNSLIKQVVKNQNLNQDQNKMVLGLNFDKFKEALFRICIKSKETLNNLIKKKQQNNQSIIQSNNNTNQIVSHSSNSKSPVKPTKKINTQLSQDYLFDPTNVTDMTLDQLYRYLHLPDDQLSLQNLLRNPIDTKAIIRNTLKQQKGLKNDIK